MGKMELSINPLVWVNPDLTFRLVILKKKFNPKNVLGVEYQALKSEQYQLSKEPVPKEVLINPYNPTVMYSKELIDRAKAIVGLFGYKPKLYAPKTEQVPLIIHFTGDNLTINPSPKVMVIAPRIYD